MLKSAVHTIARVARIMALAAVTITAAGCAESSAPMNWSGAWEDLGQLPAVERAWTITTLGNNVFVGTSQGVYTRSITGAEPWRAAGLPKLDVHVLRAWEGTHTIYAAGFPQADGVQPVYRSTDGGATWVAGGAGLTSDFTGEPLGLHDLALQPGVAPNAAPVLYAVASGTNIARSLDDGATWTIVHGVREEMATYDCLIHVMGSWLYQGCEAPLDMAWIRRYDIGDREKPSIGDGSVVVDDIENRRINGFASFPSHPTASARLYVGIEGGLLAVEPSGSWRYLHKFTQESPRYTYVRSIWVDPANEKHIIFGGGEEHDVSDRAGLWETLDEGATVRTPQNPFGIDFLSAGVPAGVSTGGTGWSFLMLVDRGGKNRRVLHWGPLAN